MSWDLFSKVVITLLAVIATVWGSGRWWFGAYLAVFMGVLFWAEAKFRSSRDASH